MVKSSKPKNHYAPESDDTYYATMDFEIKNKTGSAIDYIKVTTYFSDKNGKSIGTMISDFGATL